MTEAWTAPKTWSVGELVTAAYMNTHLRDNLDFIGGMTVGGTDISALSAGSELATPGNHTIWVPSLAEPLSNTNFSTLTYATTNWLNSRRDSSGAQNDTVRYEVPLLAGTWTFTLDYQKASSYGIFTVKFDTVSQGTIDAYNGTTQDRQRSQLTGLVVATSGVVAIDLTMATKNASSSNYTGAFYGFSLVRTA